MQSVRGIVSTYKSSATRFSDSKRVFNEIPNAIRGSNIRWRGMSFAASVPSDSSNPHRSQKRTSRRERRAIVESFVHKYRASNAGKFPTPSLAQKQVGGSYYVVRQIIQEMEYACRMSPINNRDDVLLEKAEKVILPYFDANDESQISTEVEESSLRTASYTSQDLSFEARENSSMKIINNTKMEEVPLCHSIPDRSCGHQKKLESEAESLQPFPEEVTCSRKSDIASEDLRDSDGLKREFLLEGDQEGPESENFQRDDSKKSEQEEEPSLKGSPLWGNLKSFATGIINFWRKM
ncbi:uncharacterized protein LOC143854591 [Tasmannia lanceolata]|uniref:uncharacterized protein LOC143854591 n=1 Tax=Tasmannia lanceolata TaxID=3420 RepID=UPI0040649EBD